MRKAFCKVLISILLLTLTTELLVSQNINYTKECAEARATIDESISLINVNKIDEALLLLIEVTNSGIQDSCPLLLLESYQLIAELFYSQYDIENSLNNYLNAISIAEKVNSDSLSVRLYREVGEIFYQEGVYKKAVEYYNLAFKLIEKSDSYNQQIYFLENIGLSYLAYNDYDGATWAFTKILSIYNSQTINNKSAKIRATFQLSDIYRTKADWKQTTYYNELLLKEMEVLDDTLGIILSLNNIAYSQISDKQFKLAESNLTRAIDLSQFFIVPSNVMAGIYTNLGICYQNQGIYTKAINNLNNAISFINKEDNPDQLANTYNTMAWIYYQRGDMYNATQQSRISIEWAIVSNNKQLLAECYKTYSMLLREGNDHIAALDYFEKYSAIQDSIELNKRVNEQRNEELLSRLERAEKEQKLYIADKEMQELMLKQLRLESERQQQEIQILRQDREMEQLENDKAIQSLQLAKQEQEAALQKSTIKNLEQQNAIKEYQIKQKEAEEQQRQKEIALLQSEKERQQLQIEKETEARKRAIWMLILSSLILIIVIYGLIITRKKNTLLAEQKLLIEHKNQTLEKANADIIEKNYQLSEQSEEIRAQNEEITTQKELIEDKNKSITDSIQYASLIQNAVLPTEEILSETFSDYFVLYKPRDIVSGDFWWYHRSSDRTIIAVADCTGHGVPGAFLSMLGTALLNEIANQNERISANELLNLLKEKMIEALVHNRKGDPRKDGMDIALCIFAKGSNIVEIAGANNPVYVLRDGTIEIIKGDKVPIGLHHVKTLPFTLKIFEYKPNDVFYLFSDGYPDQFGGEEGRKLMYKQFRELILSSANLPLNEQGEFLDESFKKWQGYNEQVDDVLVVGLKV